MNSILWISATVVVAALGGYAAYLALQLRKQNNQRAKWRTEVEQLVQERSDKIHHSISVIAAAMLEKQMSISECAIRLSTLLNQLGPIANEARFQSLHRAAGELEHIPILDEWKQLKFRERMGHMKEMAAVEEKYADFVLDICQMIRTDGVGRVESNKNTAANGQPSVVETYQP